MSAPAPSAALSIRSLTTEEERRAAACLYRTAFGLPESDPAISPKLLAAVQHNGGSALGAFDEDGRIVGFTYGFVGIDESGPYHYSQTAAVDPLVQGRGVGRRLKRAQAEVARRSGMTTMRWAYDPLHARNAHFNLDVLGAVGRWFHRDYYGMRDALGRTDRIVVEWDLAGAVPPADVPAPTVVPGWGATRTEGGLTWLAVPARSDVLVRAEPARAAAVRDRVAAELARLIGGDRVLQSCRRVDDATALYRIGELRR
jgi:predicted GNAT superfamily acetyltransferase